MFDADRLKQLTQTILKDAQPSARMEALLEIRRYDDPRVTDLLRQISEKDKNREVRDLAKNLYTKRQLANEVGFSSPAVEPEAHPTADWLEEQHKAGSWSCPACGGENADGPTCRFCGAEHQAELQAADRPLAARPLSGAPVFVLNSRNQAFVTGQASRPQSMFSGPITCGTLFFIPFILVGLFVIFWAFRDYDIWRRLDDHGVTAPGTVTDKYISSGDDSDTYYVYYHFDYKGRLYTAEQDVEWDVYNRVETGAATTIVLLPEDPNISKLAEANVPPTFLFIFAIIWNGIISILAFGMLAANRRRAELMREGQLISGEISSIRGHTDSDNDYIITVEYRFRAPDTRKMIVGRQKATRNDLKRQTLPDSGTPVAIMYRDERRYLLM